MRRELLVGLPVIGGPWLSLFSLFWPELRKETHLAASPPRNLAKSVTVE
jgi:hypothetical protein